MKRITAILAAATFFLNLNAGEKMKLMPAWQPQSQFAGYYVALEKGFYREAGLDVSIEHVGINSSRPPVERIASGEVDIIVSNPIQAILSRQNGVNLKNVLQVSQTTGMMIVSHKPINGAKSLEGCRIARWKSGFNEMCDVYCQANKIKVEWVPFLSGIDVFLSGAVDATVVMSYSEYFSLIEALGSIPEENTIRFADSGYDIPEDGLYVTEKYLKEHPENVRKFCEATKRGWNWCIEHREEAVDIVMDYVRKCGIRTNRFHQSSMLDEMLNLLVSRTMGEVDYGFIQKDVFDTLVKYLVDMEYIAKPVEYEDIVCDEI